MKKEYTIYFIIAGILNWTIGYLYQMEEYKIIIGFLIIIVVYGIYVFSNK